MKGSLRLPFSLLLFLATFTFLVSRSAIYNGFGSISSPQPVNPFSNPNPNPNSTLLSLSSNDAYESDLKRAVEDLIEGKLSVTSRPHKISLWQRENHHRGSGLENRLRSATRYPIRLRSPKDYRIFPEFRRSLRVWIRNRYLQPRVLSDLADLVKRPLDRHINGLEPDKNLRLYNSCAVVGNSGILLKSEYGEVIDGHEMVIRLNNARIQGYSRQVGSKTTLSFVNSNILHLCARREGCFCHPYGENVPMIMYICQPIHFIDYVTCNSSHKSPLLITDGRFDILCGRIVKYYSMKRFMEESGKVPEEWGKVKDEKMFHYSSGMQAVMLAVGICERVSVFGFGKSSEAKHHYHTNQKAELDLHDYEAEYAFYHDLAERPEVIPFINDSGFRVPPVVFYH